MDAPSAVSQSPREHSPAGEQSPGWESHPRTLTEALEQSTIVALGGGGFSMPESGQSAIDDYLLERASLVREARETDMCSTDTRDTDTRGTGAHHHRGGGGASLLPRVCFVPTASGDNPDYIQRFETAFAGRAETFRKWIGTGQLPGPGLAIDDHAAVVFENLVATSVMVESAEANAYTVDSRSDTRLEL